MLKPRARLAIFAIVLGAAGCGPATLDVTKKYTVGDGESSAMDLSAQKDPQTINIDFSSAGDEVSVLLFKESDAKGEDGILNADPSKALGKKMNSKGDKFSVDVPANTATRIIIRGTFKKTEVTLKVNNKKS